MKTYKWANNITGWVIFIIAAVTYLLTIEPTASFWDCGEFISSAYKLEVGHPPGSPIFMLTANLFTHFASEPSQVARMVNSMSALLSALTILFLFWTITRLAKKLIVTDSTKEISLAQMISILACGAVGALAYTWSDTFWFSAVEGEVYAYSSLMTGLVIWLILKWEDVADDPRSDRWLILIAYLMGISIAVHLLNLLCIPAIVLVYYFRKYPNPNAKGALIALLVSFGVVAAILYGLVQGIMEVCGWIELLFVNGFHLPYNSGVIFYIILIFGVLGWGIWESIRPKGNKVLINISFILSIFLLGIPFFGSHYFIGALLTIGLAVFMFMYEKINRVVLNTILTCLLVITVGYSSYALIIIRSTANTPMDQNSPEDVFTLRTYLSREQYGETPLFYGPTFVSEVKYERKKESMVAVTKDDGPVRTQIAKHDPSEPDRYFVSKRKEHYVYIDQLNTLFPRMYSSEPRHVQGYKDWTNFKGTHVKVPTPNTNPITGKPVEKDVIKPTFGENLKFFFNYQVCFMYWRYFMWNFSGRQNDIQGQGEILNGNWITGIKFIDEVLVGPQDDMPDSIAKNKGHNKYYMLPLLLGLLGILFQVFRKEKEGTQQFWVTFLLFFMTGLAIVIYLNQTPYQPRERDYAYAGSFYAFCIWIGIGVAGLIEAFNKYLKFPPVIASSVGAVLCLLIPIQMVSQTWDDHNRAKRYVTRDFGFNYLTTCEPDAIIFTNGDNDTFPLWYAQEVEGYRTDVRVCNLSYLQTDWYIDQMKRQAYESAPLPIDWKQYDYIQGTHDVAYVIPQTEQAIDVNDVLNWIKSTDPRTKQVPGISQKLDNIPTDKILIPVDSVGVIANGVVKPENAQWISKNLLVDLSEKRDPNGEVVVPGRRYIGKQEIMILDMLKNNADWSRPIYYAITVGSDQYLNLSPYFRQDGIAYRIMPFVARQHQPVDADVMYDNLMNKYRWGNMEDPNVYMDENCIRLAKTFRVLFGMLGETLSNQGDTVRTKQAMDYCLKVIPSYTVPYDFYSTSDIAKAYDKIGDTESAAKLYKELADKSFKNLNWFDRLTPSQYAGVINEVRNDLAYLQFSLDFFEKNNPELYKQYMEEYIKYYQHFEQFMSRAQLRGGRNR
ncbi:MAG: DUF2723 domain-containing protein [Dysgonamonadaceae bacterium]|jgi:hypothetical protein|nr:DUF2723 domain-containing protein [Dysgonamonadaceae bacterium]